MNPLNPQIVIPIVLVVAVLIAIICFKLILRIFGVIIIPQDSIGIVNKKWVIWGKNRTLPDGEIIALKGEAGWQADTLSPGVHFWLWPWQYSITTAKFYTVPNGKLAYVNSKAGQAMTNGRVLAKEVECKSFQDARSFLTNGGERGPQISIIPPGTYRIIDPRRIW
jgi:uncharacterized membrane protein YqiK